MIRRLHPGKRFCEAVIANGTLITAGITTRADGGTVTEQTRDILEQIDALLAEAGTTKARLLSAAVWLRDIADFDEFNAVWDNWVDPANLPVRATVEARLAAPELKVEIQVTALL